MRVLEGFRTAVLVAAALLAANAEADVVGRVLAVDGSPMAGATLEAFEAETAEQAGERHAAGQARTPLATTTSGADGAFRLESRRSITWVQASAPGHAPVTVSAMDPAPATITLKRVALRRGVITANGRPVAGAVVFLGTEEGAETVTRTDAGGIFEGPDPAAAPLQLTVVHRDFAPLQGYTGGMPGVKPGLDRELDTGVRIAGTAVDDASGQPVADAQVWVDDAWPLARTDAKGTFAIAHAARDWSSVLARTPQMVGAAERKAGPIVVRLKVARTLTGTVTDKATRKPLAGAMVAVGSSSGTYRTALTDSRGQYELGGLAPARYSPFVGRDGYAAEGESEDGKEGRLDLRTVTSMRFDAALRPLPRVRGRVEDDQHRPVAGAIVSRSAKQLPNVYATVESGLVAAFQGASTRTAQDGSFELAIADEDEALGVPEHSHAEDQRLAVIKPGFAAAKVPFDQGGSEAPLLIMLSRGVELQGRVADAEGHSLAGVAVSAAEDGSIRGVFPSHMMLTMVKNEGWTSTDPAGRFALRVQPGPHHLLFRLAGYAPQLTKNHDPRTGPLEVVLEPAVAVRGRVVRSDGRGLEDALIGLGRSPSGMGGVEDVTTSADGRFELAGLAPGVYEMRVHHNGLGIDLRRTVEAPTDDVQVTLAPSVTLRGRVLDAGSRQPVPRFQVAVASGASSRSVAAEDPAGAFTVEEVAVGEVDVSISAEGYAERKVEGLSLEQDSEPAPLEILLEADAPIRGRVTDPAGAPIEEADVGVVDDGGTTMRAGTDENGQYEVRGLTAGETKLTFSADGYVPETRTIDSRESTRLDVTLKRGLALKGEVVKAGVGVADAFVSAQSSAKGSSYQTTQTDDNGRFSLEGLVPGRYTVTANASGRGSAKLEDVDAQTAGPLRLTLDKSATAVLRGKVVGLPERDLGMSTIMAVNEETGESAQGSIDSSMTFRIEDAPAGRVKVRGVAMDLEDSVSRSSRTVELALAPGSETETVVEFASDIVVSGTVTRDGSPVPFVRVTFRGEGDQDVTARADGRGYYQAVGLEAGFHQVSVTGNDVSFQTDYAVTASAELDIDITGGSIQGHVVRADAGTPVPGVEVSFFRLGRGENKPIGSATTGARGVFLERSLREGRYRLITSKAGYGQEVREVDVPRGGAVEAVIELTPADGVGVTVVDARDSRPLDAIVVVRDQARRIVANRHTGSDESGALNIPLADGAYLLSTSANGYGTVTLPVTAPTQGLRVGLTPGGTLVIESERELRGRARLVQPDGEEYVRCWCNGIAEIQLKGRRTSVENVTPGSYTVEIVDSPDATTPRPVVVREGQTSTVAIE